MKKHFLIMSLLFSALLNCRALGAIPVLNSLPGAPVNFVLDFEGDSTLGNTNTPVRQRRLHQGSYGYHDFVQNGGGGVPEFTHTNSLYSEFLSSESERDDFVEDVWRMVADRFSMYNVNVTTDTTTKNDGSKSLRLVIDDNADDWRLSTDNTKRLTFTSSQICNFTGQASYNTTEGGSAILDSVSYFEFRTAELAKSPPVTPPSNISFAFIRGLMYEEDSWSNACSSPGSGNQWSEISRFVAHTACHEFNHFVGYNPDWGESTTVLNPLRYKPESGRRSGWSSLSGLFALPTLRTLAEKDLYSMEQNLGLRPGEEGDTLGAAEDLGSFGATGFAEHEGIIHYQTDDDWYKIRLTDSQVSLKFKVRPKLLFNPAPVNGTRWHAVDVKISLVDKDGTVIQTTNPYGENLTAWQPSITYDTKVSPELPSHLYYFLVEPAENDGARTHGDLGQYVITVDTIPSP